MFRGRVARVWGGMWCFSLGAVGSRKSFVSVSSPREAERCSGVHPSPSCAEGCAPLDRRYAATSPRPHTAAQWRGRQRWGGTPSSFTSLWSCSTRNLTCSGISQNRHVIGRVCRVREGSNERGGAVVPLWAELLVHLFQLAQRARVMKRVLPVHHVPGAAPAREVAPRRQRGRPHAALAPRGLLLLHAPRGRKALVIRDDRCGGHAPDH